MAKSRFTAEQIILKLREAEVEQAKGKTIEEVCHKPGIVDKTFAASAGRFLYFYSSFLL
jgi:hypothetical protein